MDDIAMDVFTRRCVVTGTFRDNTIEEGGERLDQRRGWFHQWGTIRGETVGIVEWPGGAVEPVPPVDIRFIGRYEDE